MSHQPPVPSANVSPYPLQAPPHEHRNEEDVSPVRGADTPAYFGLSSKELGIGAAVGIGSAAIVAALLYSRRPSMPRS
jgi:hypothetical protein